MEKPYHGLPYHAPKAKRPVPSREAEDSVWDEPEPLERAYPDGSAPTECWGYAKAFSQKQSGDGAKKPPRKGMLSFLEGDGRP